MFFNKSRFLYGKLDFAMRSMQKPLSDSLLAPFRLKRAQMFFPKEIIIWLVQLNFSGAISKAISSAPPFDFVLLLAPLLLNWLRLTPPGFC